MRTKGIHRQNVSQFIDSREGDESELSTCELRGGNDKGRRAFLSFFFVFISVFKKRTGVFAAGVREKQSCVRLSGNVWDTDDKEFQ